MLKWQETIKIEELLNENIQNGNEERGFSGLKIRETSNNNDNNAFFFEFYSDLQKSGLYQLYEEYSNLLKNGRNVLFF